MTKIISIVVLSIFVTAGLIYLTPLKWINVIEPKVIDIDSSEFYDLYTQNPDRYIFIDVRSQSSYERNHARGSINVPLHMMYDYRHSLPKRGQEIILICSGGRASGVAYSYLQHYGFFNIKRIEGGIEEWEEKGLPVASSM
jgi:rhodanese-related sulfurtransferase